MAEETRTYAETRDGWLRLLPPLATYTADFPHLEPLRFQLESVTVQVGDLLAQQADLAASKQDVSRRLQALIAEGRQTAALLRAAVKQRYGTRSEKLTAFNLQPFRGRKTTKPEEIKKAPPADAPPASTPQIAE